MRKPFDPLREFDSSYARELGTRIGTANRLKKEQSAARSAKNSMLEAAMKEAAKKERERREKEEREKKSGRKETKVSKDNESTKRKIEAAGGSTEKPQSAIGKALNLDPDNNFFFDALDILGRPLNAVNEASRFSTEVDAKYKKQFDAGEISQKEYFKKLEEGKGFGKTMDAFMDGLSGRKKTWGTDVYKEAGMEGPSATALGIASDVALDPLNALGGPIGKGVIKGFEFAGKGISKIPGANVVGGKLDEIFGKGGKRRTLSGETTDDLLDIERSNENMRLYQQDRSQNNVARAMRQSDNGVEVGKIMEEPLRMKRPLDITAAPNVLNSSKALDRVGRPGFNATDPLGRISEVSTKTTQDFKVMVDKVSDKEVRDWLKANNLPGAEKKGRVSKFNRELYVTENRQKLASRVKVESQVRQVLNSTKDSQKAAQAIKEMPEFKARFRGAAETLMKSNDDLRKWADENGVKVEELEGYMAHFLTKEAQKYVDELGSPSSSGAASIGGDKRVLGRKIKESVRNANRIQKRETNVDEWFNPDAFVATAGGQQRMINFIAKQSVTNRVLGDSRFAREIASDAPVRKGLEKVQFEGKTYEVTKGAKQVITNFERHVTDEGVGILRKGFDTLTNAWKKTALFSGGYHLRNMTGNSWNMYVSGLRADEVIGRQAEAITHLENIKQARAGADIKIKGAKAQKKFDEISSQYDEFVGQGLKQSGSTADFARDAGKNVMNDIRYRNRGRLGKMFHEVAEIGKQDTLAGTAGKAVNSLFDTSRRMAEEADEVARFALFRHHREAGMSAKEAAAKVREVLFDYNDLTTAEREVMKRMAPFYTWLRKNSEFQIKAFANRPEKFSHLNSAINNTFVGAEGMDQELLPEYMKDGMTFALPGDKTLQLNLPAGDLSKWMNPGKLAMDSVHPFIKTGFELGFNESALNGRPIDNGEMVDVLGMEMGPKTAHTLQNMLPPVRNLNSANQQALEGAGPLDVLAQATGSRVARDWDAEGYQNQADWKEKERLEKIMNRMKQQGTDIPTVQDLKDQGVPVNDQEEADQKFLKDFGYDQRQTDMLLSLKNKVRNGNAETAAEAIQILQQMGINPEVIEMVTSDYLDY